MTRAPALKPVAFAIRHRLQDQTVASHVFPYVAICVLLAITARLTVFIRQRSLGDFAQIDGFAAAQIGLVGFACVWLLCFTYRSELRQRLAGTSGSLIIGYYLLSALSACWSPLPAYSLFRSIEYLSQLLLAFIVIWYCSDFYQAERRILPIAFVVLILGVGVNLKYYGFQFALEAWHTNSYSVSAAIVFCYCLAELLASSDKSRRYLWGYGIGAFAFLILGTSVASFAAASCGVIVAILLSMRGRLLLSYMMVGASVIGLVILWSEWAAFLPKWTDIGQQLKIYAVDYNGQVYLHLHGRVLLWEQYFDLIKQSPVYGHGLAVSSRLAGWSSTNAHNGLLAVILGTGIIGLIMILLAMRRLFSELRVSLRVARPGTVGCASALTASLVNNLSISLIGEQWQAPSLVLVLIFGLHLFFVTSSEDASERRAPEAHRQATVHDLWRQTIKPRRWPFVQAQQGRSGPTANHPWPALRYRKIRKVR